VPQLKPQPQKSEQPDEIRRVIKVDGAAKDEGKKDSEGGIVGKKRKMKEA
jgi:hypothetical protein